MSTRSKTRTLEESFDFVFNDIFEQPPSGNIRVCCEGMGVVTLSDLLELTKEDMHDWSGLFTPPGELLPRTLSLRVLDIKKIQNLQSWYAQHDDPDETLWNTLSKKDYVVWYNQDQTKRVRASLGQSENVSQNPDVKPDSKTGLTNPTTSAISNFQKSIKLNLNDYSKFKEDKYWHKWVDQITSIACMHKTDDVLDPMYVPVTDEEKELFLLHNTFMYTMLLECVQTSKGKLCIRAHHVDKNAQYAYADLTNAYQGNVTVQMAITTLRSELTTLRLDSGWKRSCEAFLTDWAHKILDLEEIQNSQVTDKEKRQWLDATVQSHKELEEAVRQALVIETMSASASGANPGRQMAWEPYFDMIMSIAKTTDNTRKIASKQRQAHSADRIPRAPGRDGRGRGRGRTGRGDTPWVQPPANVKYKGPSQVMEKYFRFSAEDWPQLTQAQRDAMFVFRREKQATYQAKLARIAAAAQTTPAPIVPAQITIASGSVAPSVVTTETLEHTLRDILSNSAARKAATLKVTYKVNNSKNVLPVSTQGSLIDGGANGGMSGADVRLLETTFDFADVTGITENAVRNLPIGTCAGLVESTSGPIIVIMNQYAHYGKGNTVHSVNQLLDFGMEVDPVPKRFGGKQRIRTPSGHVIPLNIRNGLAYMDMSPPSDRDLDELVHVLLTSDAQWNPDTIDDEYLIEDVLLSDFDLIPDYRTDTLNDYGELINRSSAMAFSTPAATDNCSDFADYVDDCIASVRMVNKLYFTHEAQVERRQMDFNRLKPNFGWLPIERIKRTLENTTQYARADTRIPMRKHFKTRFPAANVPRWDETVATDMIFSDVPAHDDGIKGHGGTTIAQLFTGIKSLVTDLFPLKSKSDMVGAFEDLIRRRGAPNALGSDNAKEQTAKAVDELLRMYHIGDFQCEPHYQHQNDAERRIQDIKKLSDGIMDRTGTPSKMWLLCILYVVYLHNHMSVESLGWKTPLQCKDGQRSDVSALLLFRWWEPVYYSVEARTYPSGTREKLGRWVGIAENQGDALTYLVLDDNTEKVVVRSNVRSALDPNNPNLRAETPTAGPSPVFGEVEPSRKPILMSASELPDGKYIERSELRLPKFTPEELLGLTFIRETADGQKVRAKIVRQIIELEDKAHEKIKFLCELGESQIDELITYNELCEIVESQHEAETDESTAWAYKSIIGHQGPLKPNHPDYKGSRYNVLVSWEDGTESYEPVDIVRKDDAISLAQYAVDNDLLDTEGWKSLKRIAKNRKVLQRMLKQSVLAAKRYGSGRPVWMFGVQVPNNDVEADRLDIANGNTKWAESRKKELDQMDEYSVFRDTGIGDLKPAGFKKINIRMIYSVKHDLRHKARLVAGGHLTDPSEESNYSGVVSLRSLRILLTVAELNGMTTKVADIGNAYLEAYTKEKVYIVASGIFGERAGHTLIIEKALYGLRSSGARFHDRLSDTLRDMGYVPCKADPDVWLKDCGTHYEYVCVYVDDLMVMSKDPDEFFRILTEIHKYKLKGVGDPAYHLGGDFFRDDDGTLAWGAKSYVEKMLRNYEIMFSSKPKMYTSPMESGDHPELDVTELLDADGISQYQSLIGALQWAITLGRFELLAGIASMASFRVAPRVGHLERLKRMYGYLRKRPDAAIRFRTGIPNHERAAMPDVYDWSQSVYGALAEDLPSDMPIPKGKAVRITTYEDANLMHCLLTGRSCTGVIHLLNQTPIYWFSKKQKSVETATYGSEFVAAKIATEQIMDLKYTVRMMGIPLDGPAWMFGDNQSVIVSSTLPHSALNKRHNALAYHRVREAVAAGVMYFMKVSGKTNVSDIFTKFLPWADFWPLVQPLLFWKGETKLKVDETLPLDELVAQLMKLESDLVIGLRGVTSDIEIAVVSPITDHSGV